MTAHDWLPQSAAMPDDADDADVTVNRCAMERAAWATQPDALRAPHAAVGAGGAGAEVGSMERFTATATAAGYHFAWRGCTGAVAVDDLGGYYGAACIAGTLLALSGESPDECARAFRAAVAALPALPAGDTGEGTGRGMHHGDTEDTEEHRD